MDKLICDICKRPLNDGEGVLIGAGGKIDESAGGIREDGEEYASLVCRKEQSYTDGYTCADAVNNAVFRLGNPHYTALNSVLYKLSAVQFDLLGLPYTRTTKSKKLGFDKTERFIAGYMKLPRPPFMAKLKGLAEIVDPFGNRLVLITVIRASEIAERYGDLEVVPVPESESVH